MSTSCEGGGNDRTTNTGDLTVKQPNPRIAVTDNASASSWSGVTPTRFTELALPDTLACLGHEVRAPLAIIDGYTSTLLSHGDQLAANEHREFLAVIQEATKRLEDVTEQLLQIAHLEAGMIQLDLSLVDLAELGRAAVSQTERLVPEGLRDRLCFVVQCWDTQGKGLETPALVQGDLLRLRQVVEHLVHNAVLYSPDGGRIEVIIQPAAPGSSPACVEQTGNVVFWELCVRDSGIGIPPEHLERIFEPFYRVDTRLTREQYGLGVGLAACRHLVRLHHGRIWAESCPDGGSAFHVWLPAALADVDDKDAFPHYSTTVGT
jgi:signal transduction histidine kinase